MRSYYLDLALPWSGPQREDQRFRRILGSTLATFAVIATVVSTLSLPPLAPPADANLPPRIAYIIGNQSASPSNAGLGKELGREAPSGEAPAKMSAPGEGGARPSSPQPSKAPLTARQQAARAGVLAFRDALKDLREAPPPKVAAANTIAGGEDGRSEGDGKGRSLLIAGLSQGSGGIEGDLAGQGEGSGVGGLAGLPGGTGEGGGTAGGFGQPGSPNGAQQGGRAQRRPTRSEEEIQEILDRNKSRMYALYNRELRIHPALQGKVVLSITIAPSGQVTECRIVYSELDAASLESKLILLIKRIDFGNKPEVPVVTTRVPIEFFPA